MEALANHNTDRAAWLAERRSGIGSSDAPAVCGQSPWRTPLAVYLDKIGDGDSYENTRMRWGTALEHVIAEAWTERFDMPLCKVPMMRHSEHPWMLASCDRVTACGERIVECKNVGANLASHWGDDGSDEVPGYVLVQCQHQMHVTGIPKCDVAALIGGSDFRVFHLEHRADIAGSLIAIERAFWRCVEEGKPPHPDWSHPSTPALIEALHRPGETEIALGVLEEEQLQLYQWATEQVKQAETLKAEAKAQLIASMGSAGRATFPGGQVVTRKTVTRKAYTVKESSYTTFHVKQPRGT